MEHGFGAAFFKFGTPKDALPLVGVDMPNEIIYDESFATYLADKRHLNSGGCVDLLDSPKSYIYKVAGYGEQEDEPDYFRFGRAAHMAILEPAKFRDHFIVEPKFTGMTKDGRESEQSGEAKKKRDEWRANLPDDAVVLKAAEMEMLCEMIDTLIEHPQAANMFKNGKPEVTGRFTHPKYNVRCKIRPDYVTWIGNKYYFFDLKTARSASAGLFATDAARLRYDVKMAFYWDGLTAIFKQEPEGCALIPIEKSIPSMAEVFWLNEEDLATGRRQYHYAIETLLKCMENETWPRRKAGGQMLSFPQWRASEPLPEYEWGNHVKGQEVRTEDEVARGVQQG